MNEEGERRPDLWRSTTKGGERTKTMNGDGLSGETGPFGVKVQTKIDCLENSTEQIVMVVDQTINFCPICVTDHLGFLSN